uniref:A disintegrin and metalloproteinase with thrombospondin motifs 4-like n=1 Tax=Petromyzon marinus TaxID=7757 RepID=A0AAJ7TPF7_PETMA|nr:A disintegrin and metalloproteinase with thrombospondin motifs 4-like [Petromyzon marinus]
MLAPGVCVLLLVSATSAAAFRSDVTLPRRASPDGQHLGPGQRHFEPVTGSMPTTSLPAPPLLYSLSAFGRRFQISLLRPEASFLGPALSVHHRGGGARCFYSGIVRDVSGRGEEEEEEKMDRRGLGVDLDRDGSGEAVLSVCGGLSGSFQHGGRVYSIRPLAGNRRGNGDNEEGQEDEGTGLGPHLITRSEVAGGSDQEHNRQHSHHDDAAADDDDDNAADDDDNADDDDDNAADDDDNAAAEAVADVDDPSEAEADDGDNKNNNNADDDVAAKEDDHLIGDGDNTIAGELSKGNHDDVDEDDNDDDDYDDESEDGDIAGERSPSSFSAAPQLAPVRTRRFVSTLRYLSVLLVADEGMALAHGASHVEQYLLDVAARAARLFSHASLDNAVRLSVAGVVVLQQQQQRRHGSRGGPPVASSSGGLTLRNFCEWQKSLRRAGGAGAEHFDTAVLFTRVNICGASDCSTLGVADVGTVCDPARSCAVIEDDGVQTAFTLAHELGHLLGLPHDDSKQCGGNGGAPPGSAATAHIMGETLMRVEPSRPWSTCSARHLTDFLDNGHGDCLKDNLKHSKSLSALPQGALLSHDAQCRAVFGSDFRHCALPGEVPCLALWCRNVSAALASAGAGASEFLGCQTRHSNWAEGTACGLDSECSDGQCVTSLSLVQVPVDGQWGEWGAWSECSRSCGGGVQLSSRGCDAPEPRHGGAYCVGQRVQYRSCNTLACGDAHSADGKSFRDEQCEAFNAPAQNGSGAGGGGGLFPGGFHPTGGSSGGSTHWRSKYAGVAKRDRCKLVCQLGGSDVFAMLRHKVVDGTPCWPDNSGVCVQGKCVRAGCDHVIGSRSKADKCGVCGGNGSTCRKVSGSFNHARIYGYNTVVTIPAGATSVEVKQRGRRGGAPSSTYLAVRGAAGGPYLMNERDIPLPGGALLLYSGSSGSLERLQSYGTLREPVTVQALSLDPSVPIGIKYSFFVPKGAAAAAAAAAASSSGGRKVKEAKGPAGQKAPKRVGKNT